jgi:hypothetical protein
VRPTAILVVPLLYVLFWLAAVLAGPAGLLVLPFSARRASLIFQGMNRLAATLLGFDGKATISKECGRRPECRACAALCAVLHLVLERDHCAKEAEK